MVYQAQRLLAKPVGLDKSSAQPTKTLSNKFKNHDGNKY
jgi:hypothetical protein